MTATRVNLRELAVRRDGPHGGSSEPALKPRPRPWLTRYVLPGVILLGFTSVLAWAARDQLLPSRSVTVLPVLTTRTEVQNEGTPLFQAAGWVEPRPTATVVTALAEGVVDKLFVVEGQRVQAGDKVALLYQADAALALQTAEVEQELRHAEEETARATVTAARANLEKPSHLQAALSEAESLLAAKATELGSLPFQIATARGKLALAERNLLGKQAAAGAFAPIVVERAQSEVDGARSQVGELEGREQRVKKEVVAQEKKCAALQQRLELKTDETKVLAEAEANLKAAQARCKQAQLGVNGAKLRLDRMTITAPVSGQVLALVARPGTRVSGLSPGSLQDSSTIITLFDPALLQVRADVRLEDVSRVQLGQKVKIETAAVPGGPLEGAVLQITSLADRQKNTLEVKVGIQSPPPAVRPDMLVQVTFLAPPAPKAKDAGSQPLRLLVQRQMVESREGGASVWLADRGAGVARKRAVKLGQAAGEFVEVVEGLHLTDRLISGGREGLTEGARITITGEDSNSVIAPAASRGGATPQAAPEAKSGTKK